MGLLMGAKKIIFSAIILIIGVVTDNKWVSDLNIFQMFLYSNPTSPSIANSQYRTAFHFQPSKNWINDPNGPMFYNGMYHLFYQYNPNGPEWFPGLVWGHSTSLDLINWSILNQAISRTDPFDINGCWSGSATILSNGEPVIMYTGIDKNNRQVQNIAFAKNVSDLMLREWIKPGYNPVIDLPEGIGPDYFRDPTTGWLGEVDGYWRVAVGSMDVENHTGVVFLFKSKDFVNWTKTRRPLRSVDDIGMLECPDFFPVIANGSKEGVDASADEKFFTNGDLKHVLKVSIFDYGIDVYTIGSYSTEKDVYSPMSNSDESPTGLRYDYGKFYSSKSFFDPKTKRRILWAWLDEVNGISDNIDKGWAGIQIVPRVVWVDESGEQLRQWPIKELESLRRKEVGMEEAQEFKGGASFEVKGLAASQADVEVEFEIPSLEEAEEYDPCWSMDPQKICTVKNASVSGGVGPFGLLVLASDNLDEYTAVFFRIFKAEDKYVTLMCSDQSRSSLRTEVSKTIYGGFVNIDIKKTQKISLRTLIDHSVVESFGDGGRTCITSRVYPTSILTDNTHLYVFNNGTESVKVSDFKAWEMAKAQID